MYNARKQGVLYPLPLLVWLLLISPASAQSRATRIYIANDDHTDLMWSADVDTYSRAFVEMLDWHMKLCDKTGPNPSPYRNRFNCDGSYWLWCYEQAKTPAEFAALISKIKEGSISAPLNTVVSCYGGQPLEAVLRGMYYAGRLERQHQLRFPLAVAMENQTLPLGLASLFAGSGAKYSWRGVCGCATKMDLKALTARPREIYWWTGSDGQKILMKWHSLVPPGNQRIGGYSEAFDPTAAIQFLDSDRDFLARYRNSKMTEAYRVRGAFGFGWDALDRKTGQAYLPDPKNYPQVDHFHEIAMKHSTPQRQVIVSNEIDFFEDFEREYGESLDRLSVTYGNEWDLYSASMSETTARVKRAVEKLRTAELLSAMICLREPNFMKSRTEARHRAFIHLGLFWEHNWTADGPISRDQRAAWQESLANQIESYVESLQRDAMQRLGESIPFPEGSKRFFVLNPLGWRRSDVVDFAYPGPSDVHVHDLSSGRDVPFQWVVNAGRPCLRILAQDVPSAGYKVFEIRQGKGNASEEEAATVSGPKNDVLDNTFLQLTIAEDGAIRSFIDKENQNRELAAKVNGLWLNDFAVDSDLGEPLRVVHRGPVSVTVLARSRIPLPHSTAITLYRHSKRVDIENVIESNFSDVRYWGFGWNIRKPSTRSEEIGAILFNKKKSLGGDYSDTHARYDHVTVNHFVDVSDDSNKVGVTLSNPDLAFANLGNSTHDRLDDQTPLIKMLAGGQVDGPKLGIPSQNGNARFLQRFALQSHGSFDAVPAMKFALEHQNPLVAGAILGDHRTDRSYPEREFSLMQIDHPAVLLWTLKVHEDGIEKGLIARLWNLSDSEAMAHLSMPRNIDAAFRTTHIETDIEPCNLSARGALEAHFSKHQLQTYRLTLPKETRPSRP